MVIVLLLSPHFNVIISEEMLLSPRGAQTDVAEAGTAA